MPFQVCPHPSEDYSIVIPQALLFIQHQALQDACFSSELEGTQLHCQS